MPEEMCRGPLRSGWHAQRCERLDLTRKRAIHYMREHARRRREQSVGLSELHRRSSYRVAAANAANKKVDAHNVLVLKIAAAIEAGSAHDPFDFVFVNAGARAGNPQWTIPADLLDGQPGHRGFPDTPDIVTVRSKTWKGPGTGPPQNPAEVQIECFEVAVCNDLTAYSPDIEPEHAPPLSAGAQPSSAVPATTAFKASFSGGFKGTVERKEVTYHKLMYRLVECGYVVRGRVLDSDRNIPEGREPGELPYATFEEPPSSPGLAPQQAAESQSTQAPSGAAPAPSAPVPPLAPIGLVPPRPRLFPGQNRRQVYPFHVSDPAGANVIVPRVHTIILGTFGTICETSIDSLCAAGLHIRHDIPVLWRDLQRQLLLDLHTASCMHARKCHTASLPPHGPGPPPSGVG